LKRDETGLSLGELVVVVALAGLVGGVIALTISRQQRFYRSASELHYAREGVRDAIEVLSEDIRGMSVSDTVRLAGDSAIEFFANIGSSVACQVAGTEVGLPAAHSQGNSLSAFLTEPDTGDLAMFYAVSATGSDEWETHRIQAFATRSLATACAAATGMSSVSEASASGFLLTLATPLSGNLRPGSPIRFLRRVRYSLYHASDGKWYLGYRRCNAVGASSCGVVQPVSGPYRPYSANIRSSGLGFEYFDSAGHALDPTDVRFALARVDISARSESSELLSMYGTGTGISDSATASVAIRNR
jgi:hypothetical protein